MNVEFVAARVEVVRVEMDVDKAAEIGNVEVKVVAAMFEEVVQLWMVDEAEAERVEEVELMKIVVDEEDKACVAELEAVPL